MPDLREYQGGCHCGRVRYRVRTSLAQVIACNCSICTKHGLLLNFVPAEAFELLAGAAELKEYLFNRNHIRHQFCTTCGVQPFARGTMPGTGEPMVAVNVRSMDDIDIGALKTTPFNGKSL